MAAPAILERLNRLNPRERRLVTLLGAILAFLLLFALPVGLEVVVHARKSEVEDLRTALDAVQGSRAQVRERQMKKDSIATRYGKKPPALAGMLEQLARQQKLEVTDSVDRPDVPHGKRFVERSTVIHLKKAGLAPISKFLESIEQSGSPVIVSRLDLRKRAGEPDSYDIELGVSAYDRSAAPPAETAAPAASASVTP